MSRINPAWHPEFNEALLQHRSLIISTAEDLQAVPTIEASAQLQALEQKIVESLPLPPGRRAHVALGFAGRSKTDPLYALRVLDRWRERTGVPGCLTVIDREDDDLTRRYYERSLDLKGHGLRVFRGWDGEIENLQPQKNAHLVFAIHPGRPYKLILDFFRNMLVAGGLALWVQERDDQDAEFQEELLMDIGEPDFELIYHSLDAPFDTPFRRVFPAAHLMLWRLRQNQEAWRGWYRPTH